MEDYSQKATYYLYNQKGNYKLVKTSAHFTDQLHDVSRILKKFTFHHCVQLRPNIELFKESGKIKLLIYKYPIKA